MKAVKTKKWYWRFNKPVYFMEEKMETEVTIADTQEKALQALQNGYGKLNKGDVTLIKTMDVELYGTLKAATPSNEINDVEDFGEELVLE